MLSVSPLSPRRLPSGPSAVPSVAPPGEGAAGPGPGPSGRAAAVAAARLAGAAAAASQQSLTLGWWAPVGLRFRPRWPAGGCGCASSPGAPLSAAACREGGCAQGGGRQVHVQPHVDGGHGPGGRAGGGASGRGRGAGGRVGRCSRLALPVPLVHEVAGAASSARRWRLAQRRCVVQLCAVATQGILHLHHRSPGSSPAVGAAGAVVGGVGLGAGVDAAALLPHVQLQGAPRAVSRLPQSLLPTTAALLAAATPQSCLCSTAWTDQPIPTTHPPACNRLTTSARRACTASTTRFQPGKSCAHRRQQQEAGGGQRGLQPALSSTSPVAPSRLGKRQLPHGCKGSPPSPAHLPQAQHVAGSAMSAPAALLLPPHWPHIATCSQQQQAGMPPHSRGGEGGR